MFRQIHIIYFTLRHPKNKLNERGVQTFVPLLYSTRSRKGILSSKIGGAEVYHSVVQQAH